MAKLEPEGIRNWYALAHDGRYFGQAWEIQNGACRRPRSILTDLRGASLFFSLPVAEAEARRARGILGLEFRPVPVRFEDRGTKPWILHVD